MRKVTDNEFVRYAALEEVIPRAITRDPGLNTSVWFADEYVKLFVWRVDTPVT